MRLALEQSADHFVSVLKNNPFGRAYLDANSVFFNDTELAPLRKLYNDELNSARKKQYEGALLTQKELNSVCISQAKVIHHPITQQFTKARAEVLELLSERNIEISTLLGFNYAKLSAAPAKCG